MSTASSALIVPIDPQLASMIVANMLENWLDFSPNALTTAEVTDEPENLRTAAEQTGLHLCASVDACPSAPPSREHRASVCAAKESSGTGLERNVIYSCCSAIRFATFIGECHHVFSVHLVVQSIEAKVGRSLRFVVQRRLQLLNT